MGWLIIKNIYTINKKINNELHIWPFLSGTCQPSVLDILMRNQYKEMQHVAFSADKRRSVMCRLRVFSTFYRWLNWFKIRLGWHEHPQQLFSFVGHTKICLFNFNISWTRLSEFFPLIGILNVPPHACELGRNVKVAVLLGSNLRWFEGEDVTWGHLKSQVNSGQILGL